MLTQKYPQWLQTATSSLWAIYMASPGHFRVAGVPRSLIHIQEHLQAIQEQIDQILRLSTSFVSVSGRINSLESVRARCCALWLVLEWTNKYFGVPAPWSIWWLAGTSSTLRLGVERRRQHCTGDGDPSFVAISLSENRDQGDRDCVHRRDLIAGKRYSSWMLQQYWCRCALVAIWIEPRDKFLRRKFAFSHPYL